MILITGATGTIGSHVLRLFASRGEPVRAMTRDPASLNPPAGSGVDVVRADFDDPASLARAAAGVQTVFLVTVPGSPTPRHDLAMLEAARSAGVARVVRLSAIGTGEKFGAETVGAWHLDADRAVRASGMAWTLLRPSVFASNFLQFASMVNAAAPVPNLTGAGRQGVIDPRDVAAVAVEALTTAAYTGQVLTLTGPELLSVPDQADLLGRVLGRPVQTVDLTVDVAREQLLASGMDAAAVAAVITGVAWARAGHNATLTEEVARVLGRPPISFETWARDHQDALGRLGR